MAFFRQTLFGAGMIAALAGLGGCELVGGQTPMVTLAGLEPDDRVAGGGAFLATLNIGNRTGYTVLIERVDLLVEEPGQGDDGGPDLALGTVEPEEFWIVAYDTERIVVPVSVRPGFDAAAIIADAALEPPGVVLRGNVWINHDPRPVPFGPLPR